MINSIQISYFAVLNILVTSKDDIVSIWRQVGSQYQQRIHLIKWIAYLHNHIPIKQTHSTLSICDRLYIWYDYTKYWRHYQKYSNLFIIRAIIPALSKALNIKQTHGKTAFIPNSMMYFIYTLGYIDTSKFKEFHWIY